MSLFIDGCLLVFMCDVSSLLGFEVVLAIYWFVGWLVGILIVGVCLLACWFFWLVGGWLFGVCLFDCNTPLKE